MSITINTNLSSLMVQLSLKRSTADLNVALEQMTTGYRINSAKDDAACYTIATKMGIDLSSYRVAYNNTQLGISLLNTATSSLDNVTTHLQRMRDLAEQAANGTYGFDSINAIQMEINQRIEEIKRVISSTEYNGIKLYEDDIAPNRIVNQTNFISGETYYIANSDDLVALQDLVNGGANTSKVTFELISDIDMSGINFRGIGVGSTNTFKGTFKGNNFKISNLTINTTEDGVGLFAKTYGAVIESVILVDCDILGKNYTGGLAGSTSNTTITSCYVQGLVNGQSYTAGLIGDAGSYTTINSSYVQCDVKGSLYVGGFIGVLGGGAKIDNSYSESTVTGSSFVGGGFGKITSRGSVSNFYVSGSVSGNKTVGGFSGEIYSNASIEGYYNTDTTGQANGVGNLDPAATATVINGVTTSELNALINSGVLPKYNYLNNGNFSGGNKITLQVGIDSSNNSTISFDTAFSFNLNIDVSTSDNARNAIDTIDNMLNQISAKQTELGAVMNRLDSVLDSIDISIENITSSLSTIKDADIAKVSSDFIRAQILQQASASLLTTANQSPSFALNLI